MNRQGHLLTRLAEEASEVIQRVCKIKVFGIDEIQEGKKESNRQRLVGEINDFLGVLSMLENENILSGVGDIKAIVDKKNKVEKYLLYCKEIGTLS